MIFLIFVLFGVSILIFSILMTFSPERRAVAYIDSPAQIQDIDLIIRQNGLDDPFYVQYTRWVTRVFSGNLGWSLVASRPVWEAFWAYFPVTLELAIFSTPIIILLGIWLGTQAGIHRNKAFDHITRILAIIGWSLPTFLFALIMLMVFYGYFSIFPPGVISDSIKMYILENPDSFKRYTGLYTIDGILNGQLAVTLDALRHLVMPVLTQVVVVVALLMRVMRSSMIEEISRDFILTAFAKGADKKTVYYKHAQKNALIPVITIAGYIVAFSVEGSIAVEIVFNRKGIGWWMANSTMVLDISVLMSICLFFGLVFVITNLVVDILYAYIDPRIRLD